MTERSSRDVFHATSVLQRHNAGHLEQIYARYAADPSTVDKTRKRFFAALTDDAGTAEVEAAGPSGAPADGPSMPKDDVTAAFTGEWPVARGDGSARRFCLVVPGGTDDPHSGGGQRSAIFYRAMASIAPTDVLILSRRDTDAGTNPCFPGAHIRHLAVAGTGPRAANPVRRVVDAAWKLATIETYFRPSPAVTARVDAIVADLPNPGGYDLVVYRFFRPLALCAEANFGDGCGHALDLDDRDDQKYAATLERRFGRSAPVRWLSRHLSWRIRRVFRAQLPRLRRIWVVAEADVIPSDGLPWRVVPNVSYNVPEETPPPASAGDGLVFIGTAGHPPNFNGLSWFLRSCWPLVRAAHPDARLRVVGAGGWDGARLRGADMTGVEIVGRVDSVANEYLRARASISPIFDGGGSKIKVVESCAFGRPAICTPHSVRGFDGTLADLLPTGGDAARFAALCVEMLTDPARADELGARVMEAQRRDYSVEGVCASIRDDLLDMLDPTPTPASEGRP